MSTTTSDRYCKLSDPVSPSFFPQCVIECSAWESDCGAESFEFCWRLEQRQFHKAGVTVRPKACSPLSVLFAVSSLAKTPDCDIHGKISEKTFSMMRGERNDNLYFHCSSDRHVVRSAKTYPDLRVFTHRGKFCMGGEAWKIIQNCTLKLLQPQMPLIFEILHFWTNALTKTQEKYWNVVTTTALQQMQF